jgi:hypothetical protein
MGKSILPVIAAGALALVASGHAGVAPALGGNQQGLSAAMVAAVGQPGQDQNQNRDWAEQRQDGRT